MSGVDIVLAIMVRSCAAWGMSAVRTCTYLAAAHMHQTALSMFLLRCRVARSFPTRGSCGEGRWHTTTCTLSSRPHGRGTPSWLRPWLHPPQVCPMPGLQHSAGSLENLQHGTPREQLRGSGVQCGYLHLVYLLARAYPRQIWPTAAAKHSVANHLAGRHVQALSTRDAVCISCW